MGSLRQNKRRWWWWVALGCMTLTVFTISNSFFRVMGWTDSQSRYYLYIEHGVVFGNNVKNLGAVPIARPWYGAFRSYSSPIYSPWTLLPSFNDLGGGEWEFKFPLHVPLLASLLVVVVPLLPFLVKRRRLKAGLCIRCEYNLTGNESGVCPECGTEVLR